MSALCRDRLTAAPSVRVKVIDGRAARRASCTPARKSRMTWRLNVTPLVRQFAMGFDPSNARRTGQITQDRLSAPKGRHHSRSRRLARSAPCSAGGGANKDRRNRRRRSPHRNRMPARRSRSFVSIAGQAWRPPSTIAPGERSVAGIADVKRPRSSKRNPGGEVDILSGFGEPGVTPRNQDLRDKSLDLWSPPLPETGQQLVELQATHQPVRAQAHHEHDDDAQHEAAEPEEVG